ncbi:MAG TPA: LacI family DNA-binding transcriptional regulator [Armatimonadota bacterium]|nr:LacI family DNA-binding transcriptional regulator [Armatimonadota bacterium]
MRKTRDVVEYLKIRILNGDYLLQSLPSERELARETGVSYMTARKAMQELIHQGLIVRNANGQSAVNTDLNQAGDHQHTLPIAFLVPTLHSPVVEWWQVVIEEAARRSNRTVRVVLYSHWDDVFLDQAIEGFEGLFLLPIAGVIPSTAIPRLQQARRLVVVDEDLSMHGIPSVRIIPPSSVQQLLDHLESLGHQRIGCLNVQQESMVISQRIEQWSMWMRVHGYEGPLLDMSRLPSTPHYDEQLIGRFDHAYQIMTQWLATNRHEMTALFCTTMAAAISAMRALVDHGLQPGRDMAICVANGEGYAQYLIPSVTSLESGDPLPYLMKCLDWLTGIMPDWRGPLLMQPATVPLCVRETTAPTQTSLSNIIMQG